MSSLATTKSLLEYREGLQEKSDTCELTLTMCAGTACQACGCLPVANAMSAEIERQGLGDKVRLLLTGCHGFCEQGPLAIVDPLGVFYCHIREEDVPAIVTRTLTGGEIINELLYSDPVSGKTVEQEGDIRAVDRTGGDIMALRVTLQLYLARMAEVSGDDVLVRVDALREQVVEDQYQEKEEYHPGGTDHESAGS